MVMLIRSEKNEHKNTKLMDVNNCINIDGASIEKKDDFVEMSESKSFGSNLLW